MSSFVHASNQVEFTSATYEPAYVDRWGPGNKYETPITAYVAVRLGTSVRLSLSIEDARVLVAGVAEAVAAHDALVAADYHVDLVKAAA
ncbi:hypothetical protein [Nocardia sp. CA-119907]|uniref:hypothetical protein n=1 Tax=Nocardia sp. CA-119907 TaxID=3239973 RepID=UPI003D993AB2